MVSITNLAINNVTQISNQYTSNIVEPNRAVQKIAEQIRKDNTTIRVFEPKPLPPSTSLIAVDGGNAHEQLAGGDLIIAGATLGEGAYSKRLHADEETIPSELFSTILPHTSSNEKIERSMRALLELRILGKTAADIKIIDGAYLGNVSSILYALIDKDPTVSNTILSYNNFDEDNVLSNILETLLHPPRNMHNNIVAVVKSDSSKHYINHMLEPYGLKEFSITDRLLASRILQPGEFLKPRNINSNPGLVVGIPKMLEAPNFGNKSVNKQKLKQILGDKAGLLNRLSDSPTEEGLLWTTYFKPTKWDEYARAIKIEFLFHPTPDVTVEQKAIELIQIVDQDIIDINVQEPWCQFAADRGAKEVSTAITMLKAHILDNASTVYEAAGILKGYRT